MRAELWKVSPPPPDTASPGGTDVIVSSASRLSHLPSEVSYSKLHGGRAAFKPDTLESRLLEAAVVMVGVGVWVVVAAAGVVEVVDVVDAEVVDAVYIGETAPPSSTRCGSCCKDRQSILSS